MNSQSEAKATFMKAWPSIVRECRLVLGSELHYQAMIYHCLRQDGKVPIDQIGMNVKMWIDHPKTALFKRLDKEKHISFQGGFEPIPDIVLFYNSINGNWRRRNFENTLTHMLMAIEIKASERKDSRLRPGEIQFDIDKLVAHREEVKILGGSMVPVVLIVDSSPDPKEQMIPSSLEFVQEYARSNKVSFFISPRREKFRRVGNQS